MYSKDIQAAYFFQAVKPAPCLRFSSPFASRAPSISTSPIWTAECYRMTTMIINMELRTVQLYLA